MPHRRCFQSTKKPRELYLQIPLLRRYYPLINRIIRSPALYLQANQLPRPHCPSRLFNMATSVGQAERSVSPGDPDEVPPHYKRSLIEGQDAFDMIGHGVFTWIQEYNGPVRIKYQNKISILLEGSFGIKGPEITVNYEHIQLNASSQERLSFWREEAIKRIKHRKYRHSALTQPLKDVDVMLNERIRVKKVVVINPGTIYSEYERRFTSMFYDIVVFEVANTIAETYSRDKGVKAIEWAEEIRVVIQDPTNIRTSADWSSIQPDDVPKDLPGLWNENRRYGRNHQFKITRTVDPFGWKEIDDHTVVIILSNDNPYREILGDICESGRIRPVGVLCKHVTKASDGEPDTQDIMSPTLRRILGDKKAYSEHIWINERKDMFLQKDQTSAIERYYRVLDHPTLYLKNEPQKATQQDPATEFDLPSDMEPESTI
ncbi:hypothetical protein BDV96DRAFT_657692 [Lophiotrema nucula]|uniref:Uncharacterized protein n=1 Tax=Lophiotrema nucula TaxID=690887 RepID=A0A6A5ZDS8_9PLEO|nr:hypothetical protein BDV96DRAFT_657692 [Lophiotrema nucula]